MAIFLSTTPTSTSTSLRRSLLIPMSHPFSSSSSSFSRLLNFNPGRNNISKIRIIKCESSKRKLEIGSPIIMVEAPKVLKTAASVPCLRANSGLVNPGDVGRIVSRKPKDVWAVRLSSGNYLIDGKYFKPLELDDN